MRRVERAAGVHSMPTQGDQGSASLATTTPPQSWVWDWNRVGFCHTMSNQYELPRAVRPQRHISSKVALYSETVAALKFTSVHHVKNCPFLCLFCSETLWSVFTRAAQVMPLADFTMHFSYNLDTSKNHLYLKLRHGVCVTPCGRPLV